MTQTTPDRGPARQTSRRDFLLQASRAAGVVLLGTLPASRLDRWWRGLADPFALGVASGDPLATGVVLWTRLVSDPLAPRGGMPAEPIKVRWELAADDAFRRIVKQGDALAIPDLAHAVHVEVEGLAPAREYWYRFQTGDVTSPVGRTHTAPAAGARLDRLAFAFVSCQNYQNGYYTAYRHLAQEELSFVVHLGDYIYENGVTPTAVRQHEGPEPITLDAYRGRYARYKSDPDLQAAHARFPFILTWDDHEVANNYAGFISEHNDPIDAFRIRRAAAYQAYYEHQPLRRTSMPHGPDALLYRRLRFGDLAEFSVLDGRQYRTDQPCGDGRKPICPEATSPQATMLGATQEKWLLDGLDRSRVRWNVLANQVVMAKPMQNPAPGSGGPPVYAMDTWSGYLDERTRIMEFLARRKPSNPVVITGDIHVSLAADLKVMPEDHDSPALGSEYVGTSISSGGDGADMPPYGQLLLDQNPHVRFFNGKRGYVRCTVSPERWTSEYRTVAFITRPDGPVETKATLVTENGKPGVQVG
jgi:alkaline phosphatase D